MSYRDQIDRKCSACCPDVTPQECTGKECPLYKYRIKKKNESTSDLKDALKMKCLDCMGDSIRLVVTCTSEYCPIYPFRREVFGREVFDNEEELGDIFA